MLGLGGPEICGSAAGVRSSWAFTLIVSTAAAGIVGLIAGLKRRRKLR